MNHDLLDYVPHDTHRFPHVVSENYDKKLYDTLLYLKKYTKKNIKFYDYDVKVKDIEKSLRLSSKIPNCSGIGDIVLTISFLKKLNNKLDLHKIIKSIELISGNLTIDKISGYLLEPMLKYCKNSYTQLNDTYVITIPFQCVSGDSIFHKFKYHDIRINIELKPIYYGNVVSNISMNCSLYTYNINDINVSSDEYKKLCNSVKKIRNYEPDGNIFAYLFNSIQTDLHDLSAYDACNISLNFNHPTSDIIIMFIDNDDNIITDNMFDDCIVLINGFTLCSYTQSIMAHNASAKFGTCGIYSIPLEHMDNSQYDMPNLSHIDTFKLKFNTLNNPNSKMLVCAISSNCYAFTQNSFEVVYSS
jgi:hypothetical protein